MLTALQQHMLLLVFRAEGALMPDLFTFQGRKDTFFFGQ
jgi:hypothetical protein